jgi:hypothetical protein
VRHRVPSGFKRTLRRYDRMRCHGDTNMLILSRFNSHKHTSGGDIPEWKIFKVTRLLLCRLYVCTLSRPLETKCVGPGGVVGWFRYSTPLQRSQNLIIFIPFCIIITFYFTIIVINLNRNFIDVREITYNKNITFYRCTRDRVHL